MVRPQEFNLDCLRYSAAGWWMFLDEKSELIRGVHFRAHNRTVETKFLNSSQIFDRVTRRRGETAMGFTRGLC